ncbi:MAG: thiamine pyrophosphate-requiring protein [Comamonadaceae bacterium]|nr:MAG: thiamine pyrophosphate-requiring protein [Comamonadaceae bacterium]
MNCIETIAEILKREGVTTLFCYPTTPVIEAAAAAGIRPVLCRQERVGVDMASGYARVQNGRPPAVFAMQYGPGVENAFAGIATAYSDATPILLLPLGHPRQHAQIFPLFKSTRSLASVTRSAEDIVLPQYTEGVMRRAFSNLKNGRGGPVAVEIPLDVANKDTGVETLSYQPVRESKSAADWKDVEAAAELLLQARCPVIQAGQGVLYAGATDELVELAELLQMPVYTSVDGKSAFPETHPLSLGTAGLVFTGQGQAFFHQCDVVFGVAASLTHHPITQPPLPAGKRVIHLTHEPRDLNKSYHAEVGLLGDAKLVLRQLITALRDRLKGTPRSHNAAVDIARHRDAWLAKWQATLDSRQTPISPYQVISEFARLVPADDAIVTHDSGSPRDQMLPFYRAGKPRSYLGWGKSHQLGTGLGLTIGAKLAAPEKFCVNFMGDAAFGMTGLDFETAVRNDAPICTIVMNNSTMAIETKTMQKSHALYGTRDIGGNYAAIARDLGGWGLRVDDPAKVAKAIEEARRRTQDGQACLLEFITGAETAFSHRFGAAEAGEPQPAAG